MDFNEKGLNIYLLTIIIGPSTLKIKNKFFTDDIITVCELLLALKCNCNIYIYIWEISQIIFYFGFEDLYSLTMIEVYRKM
jgi:hypothetical protein